MYDNARAQATTPLQHRPNAAQPPAEAGQLGGCVGAASATASRRIEKCHKLWHFSTTNSESQKAIRRKKQSQKIVQTPPLCIAEVLFAANGFHARNHASQHADIPDGILAILHSCQLSICPD
jgi:hypothetical protein